jgi:hypothetical protein
MHNSAKFCCTVLLTMLQRDCCPRRTESLSRSFNERLRQHRKHWPSCTLRATTLTHHEETRFVCNARDRLPAAHTPSVPHQLHLNTTLSNSRPIGDTLEPSRPYEAGEAPSLAFSYWTQLLHPEGRA